MKKRNWVIFGVLAVALLGGSIFYTEILGAKGEKGKQLDFSDASEQLSKKGYKILAISYGPAVEADVKVEVSDAVSDKTDAEEEITKIMKNELEEQGYIDGTVKVEFKNLEKMKKEQQWFSVVPEIDKQLKRVSDHYDGIAIDVNPKPIVYILKTTYADENFNKKELKQWIKTGNEIITANNLPSTLEEGEVYGIVIRGADKEVLLSEIFGK
ncbi:hypothetical protein [Thalassobacillus devorans]|uniref:hypothetical protein n=1 Tax=Thalassobacillus devorans TaxID=279813 RepID=UPI000491A771|nr:hypothetical protein [Thalassobacillus devorans]